MKNICYPTQGTCSKLINVSIDDDKFMMSRLLVDAWATPVAFRVS